MSEGAVLTTLRQRRAAAGLSQAVLAERVGVSRQALNAIEKGRQVPSTLLSLQLARALQCGVEDLFRLPEEPTVLARLAEGPRATTTRRVSLGRVDARLVAHPQPCAAHAADGLVVGSSVASEVAVSLFEDLSLVDGNLLVAGCAPLLGVLSERLGRHRSDVRATWVTAPSDRALALLSEGFVHVAGLHLADGSDPQAHVRAARALFPLEPSVLVNLARWRQGLVVAAGNPLGLEAEGLNRSDVRLVRRQKGAGAEKLLVRLLSAGDGAEPGTVWASDHGEVARLVRWGLADVGVAIESVALAEGCDFIPLSEERFDLLLPARRLDMPAVVAFVDQLERPSFRAEAHSLPGYDLAVAGHAITVAAGGKGV